MFGFSQVLFLQKKRNHPCWFTRFHNIQIVCPYNLSFKSDAARHVSRQLLSRFYKLILTTICSFYPIRLLAHGGCDRLAGDAYSSLAPDRTAGISSGPYLPCTHHLIVFWVFLDHMIGYGLLSLPFHVPNFYHKLNPKTQSGLPRTYINLEILN